MMELLLALVLITVLMLFALGKAIFFWVGLLVAALLVGNRAYRARCKKCGEGLIAGRKMQYCNQCGAKQEPTRFFRMRCQSCRAIARSELNMLYCNRCGTSVE